MRVLCTSVAAVILAASLAWSGDAPVAKHVWKLPVFLAQGLKINLETPATEELLKKADMQCIDDACKRDVAACRKAMPNCVLVPSPASVHESEVENN
jgi:hypothetical protein